MWLQCRQNFNQKANCYLCNMFCGCFFQCTQHFSHELTPLPRSPEVSSKKKSPIPLIDRLSTFKKRKKKISDPFRLICKYFLFRKDLRPTADLSEVLLPSLSTLFPSQISETPNTKKIAACNSKTSVQTYLKFQMCNYT